MGNATILLVDDSRPVREFFADSVLQPAGYRVLQAMDGYAGLRLAQEQRPDLIIADLQMPGLSGLELKRALGEAGDQTPFILITAEGSEHIASEASLAGVSGYLPKPVDVDVLLAAVRQALMLERLRRERAEALQALEKRVHQLETLQSISRTLTASLELSQVLSAVVDAAVRLTGADAGSLFLLEEEGRLMLRATRAPGEAAARTVRRPVEDALAGHAMRTNQPAVYPPAQANGVSSGTPPRLYVPLRMREHVLGTLAVDNRQSLRVFGEADVGPLATLADHAVIAIANARLFAEVQLQSITDSLTGLFNRRHFFATAEREFQRAVRFKHSLAAIMLDIDFFKQVNDTCGHAAGDQVIVEAARRCRNESRSIDVLGRYGGEEFAFLLPETDVPGARQLAERLRLCIEATPFDTLAGPVVATASLGVAATGPEVGDVATLLNNADAALYAAKLAGRNRVVVYQKPEAVGEGMGD